MSTRAVYLASIYRLNKADLCAEELDLVIAQIAGLSATYIARKLFVSGRTTINDFERTHLAAGEAVTSAADALLEAKGDDGLHVLLERLATLREGGR